MQRHDHTVGRDGRDDAGGKRAMNVSRVETVEGGGTKMFKESGIGLFEKSGIGLFQETRIRLFKESGIGLLQNCRCAHAAGEKVVSACQMADQGSMRFAGQETAETKVFGCSTKWDYKAESNKKWIEKVQKEPVKIEPASVGTEGDGGGAEIESHYEPPISGKAGWEQRAQDGPADFHLRGPADLCLRRTKINKGG